MNTTMLHMGPFQGRAQWIGGRATCSMLETARKPRPFLFMNRRTRQLPQVQVQVQVQISTAASEQRDDSSHAASARSGLHMSAVVKCPRCASLSAKVELAAPNSKSASAGSTFKVFECRRLFLPTTAPNT
jgi:hypothetical protein